MSPTGTRTYAQDVARVKLTRPDSTNSLTHSVVYFTVLLSPHFHSIPLSSLTPPSSVLPFNYVSFELLLSIFSVELLLHHSLQSLCISFSLYPIHLSFPQSLLLTRLSLRPSLLKWLIRSTLLFSFFHTVPSQLPPYSSFPRVSVPLFTAWTPTSFRLRSHVKWTVSFHLQTQIYYLISFMRGSIFWEMEMKNAKAT